MWETWSLVCILWYGVRQKESYLLIEAIIIWFLYFESIALISKYFKSYYHFSLRYLIYIGITVIIRLIIVDHDRPMDTLIYSFAILV